MRERTSQLRQFVGSRWVAARAAAAPGARLPWASSRSACWRRGVAASGCAFWALRAALSAAGRFDARASDWLWRTSVEEESGIAIAMTAAIAATERAARSGKRSAGLAAARDRAVVLTSAEASRSIATGKTGICHIQSKTAVRKKAVQPATAAASWGLARSAARSVALAPPSKVARRKAAPG